MIPDRPSLASFLGGDIGQHAQRSGLWFRPAVWAYPILTLNFLLLMLRQIPCQLQANPSYLTMCYSDIRVLWYWRGLQNGEIPYLQSKLEYPVLIGAMMELGRRLVVLFNGTSQPNASGAQMLASAQLFMGVTAVMIFLLFVVLVWSQLHMHRPWDALMIAASPAILTAGLINWDALPVALTSLTLLAWARKRPMVAGILLGLAISAKLYPLLLFVPLFALTIRTGKWRDFAVFTGTAVGSWVAVNLPVFLLTPSGWLYFWTFNVDRGADLGSLWYALELAGFHLPGLSIVIAALMVAGSLGIIALMLRAPYRPRFAQGIFLIVVLFLVFNKVYSPQYVLWLLPLLVLARPKWLDWVVFTVFETIYFVAVWAYLDGILATGLGVRLYWLAIFFRVGMQLWLASRVMSDILNPYRDPVRMAGVDDPDGGIFDMAADIDWLRARPPRAIPT